jgi:hypothetical protein
MEKSEILSFNRQLSRVYSLVILNVMLLVSALVLNYYCLNNNKFLYVALTLNLIALILFKPWKLMREVRELFACQRILVELTKVKKE